MASRCFRLAMAADSSHAESVCNLAVLQMRDGKLEQSRALFLSAIQKGPHLFEPHFNLALLTYQVCDFNCSPLSFPPLTPSIYLFFFNLMFYSTGSFHKKIFLHCRRVRNYVNKSSMFLTDIWRMNRKKSWNLTHFY